MVMPINIVFAEKEINNVVSEEEEITLVNPPNPPFMIYGMVYDENGVPSSSGQYENVNEKT